MVAGEDHRVPRNENWLSKEKYSHVEWFRRKGLNSEELLGLTVRLETLLRCGMTLGSAVDALGRGDASVVGETCRALSASLRVGHSFSKSMARLPESFPPEYYRVVEIGEATGRLDSCLQRLAATLERQNRTMRALKSALVYPAFLLLSCAAMVFVILFFVFPMIVKVTADAGVEPPALTRALIFLTSPKMLLLLLLSALPAVGLLVASRHPVAGPHIQRLYEEYTPLGEFHAQTRVLISIRQLALMLECGIPLLKALNYAYLVGQESILVKEAYDRICREVRVGALLGECFSRQPVFPAFLSGMLSVSDELGDTHRSLYRVADLLESNLNDRVTTVTAVLEPVLMAVMGVVIGTTMVAAFLPIYNLIQA